MESRLLGRMSWLSPKKTRNLGAFLSHIEKGRKRSKFFCCFPTGIYCFYCLCNGFDGVSRAQKVYKNLIKCLNRRSYFLLRFGRSPLIRPSFTDFGPKPNA